MWRCVPVLEKGSCKFLFIKVTSILLLLYRYVGDNEIC